MDLASTLGDVGRVTEELQPKVLDLGVSKRLEDASVELVSGNV